MEIYYAHGGGYSELGGMKKFLKKIRSDFNYIRIFPSRRPMPNLYFSRKEQNSSRILRKNRESGVTGKDLFKKILERMKIKEESERRKIRIFLLIDDADCKLADKEAYECFFSKAIENFKKNLKELLSELEEIIFIWAEPEIEKWFCIDRQNCFPRNKSCGEKDLHTFLSDLLENFSEEMIYDKEKKSCKVKFSEKFKIILEKCGINYSKSEDGARFLEKVDPAKLESDKFASEGIRKLRHLDSYYG